MKILFITYFFPPRKAIASIRTYEVCKGLLAAGHAVHVVTSCTEGLSAEQLEEPPDWHEIRQSPLLELSQIPSPWRSLHEGVAVRSARGVRNVAKAMINRLCARFTTLCGFDPMLPWAWGLQRALAGAKDIDCVLVSAGPFSTLIPASRLARWFNVPLVLDYRDVWNNTPHTRFRLRTRWLELAILRQASLLVSISPSCLASIRGDLKIPSVVVTNGFGADVEARCSDREPPEASDLVYAGAFYPPKRSCQPILEALAQSKGRRGKGDSEMRFVYAGPTARHVQSVAEAAGVIDRVSCLGALPRAQVLDLQATSLCTVVVTSVDRTASLADRGIITGKIFEAIALSPWVLVISPEGSDVRELTADCPHVAHFHGGQVDGIAQWLDSLSQLPIPQNKNFPRSRFAWSMLGKSFTAAVEEHVKDDQLAARRKRR